MNITLEKLGEGRTQATVVFEEQPVKSAEEEVVKELGKEVKIKGFRPGQAPLEKLREEISSDQINEELVRKLMPEVMEDIVKKHELRPITRPRIELSALSPFTLKMVIVEKPEVKVDVKKIRKALKVKEKEAKETKETSASAPSEASPSAKTTGDKTADKKEEKISEEQIVLDAVSEHTKVELAPELIDDEVQDVVQGHAHRLSQFGLDIDTWLKQQNKKPEDYIKEVRPGAEKRLLIRFGVSWLINEWKIEVADEEMKDSISDLLKPLSDDEKKELKDLYSPGKQAYEQFRYQKMVEKVLKKLREEK
jgi:FKBP-type peptidyl-prolyl cis-trans isomerase (trigger factor)